MFVKAELYLGGYGSFDEFARKCGRKYQKTHPNLKVIFVTPYITEEYKKNRLKDIKELYGAVVYPELDNVLPRFAISYRNRWMVEMADYVVAYIQHRSGGAYKTYMHAKRRKKKIYNLTGKVF